jgi:cytochrome c-type biogenesis protein CcsB
MPWLLLALFLSEVIAVVAPKKDGVFHVRGFATLPVLMNGRIQPFDSVARNALLQIRATADVPLEEIPSWQFWHHAKKLKSTEWLLELMTKPMAAADRPVFLIHNPELLGDLKLEDKGIDKSGLRYYTYNQIQPVIPEIMEQNFRAAKIEDAIRTPLQRQVMKLANAISVYEHLRYTLKPEDTGDFYDGLQKMQPAFQAGVDAVNAKEAGKEYDHEAYERIMRIVQGGSELQKDPSAGRLYPLAVPPPEPQVSRNDWGNAGAGIIASVQLREIYEPLAWLAGMGTSYGAGDSDAFNGFVADYTSWLEKNFQAELSKAQHEYFYNDLKAFLHAMIMYIFAFLLTGAGLLTFGVVPGLSESLRRSAFFIILLAGVVHTAGLVFRMVLEGRPPVTNLYSSAIFIGWGAMVLGLILEKIYKVGIGNAVASLAGFITLLIAHNLAIGSDTMEMMRAVLDNNFWLATHVVVVTIGYASTFVAGLLAIGYVLLGLFTPILSQKLEGGGKKASPLDVGKALGKMVYGIVCFATLFSFVGTVLGGIWADQSWGRFWGWDPKENGALLIVLWNATLLHARWGGLVRERGIMAMAIFGNIVTSFSWFGVNMLGIGLHSYGFMDAAFDWLRAFIIVQLILMGLCMIPLKHWRSFGGKVVLGQKVR